MTYSAAQTPCRKTRPRHLRRLSRRHVRRAASRSPDLADDWPQHRFLAPFQNHARAPRPRSKPNRPLVHPHPHPTRARTKRDTVPALRRPALRALHDLGDQNQPRVVLARWHAGPRHHGPDGQSTAARSRSVTALPYQKHPQIPATLAQSPACPPAPSTPSALRTVTTPMPATPT